MICSGPFFFLIHSSGPCNILQLNPLSTRDYLVEGALHPFGSCREGKKSILHGQVSHYLLGCRSSRVITNKAGTQCWHQCSTKHSEHTMAMEIHRPQWSPHLVFLLYKLDLMLHIDHIVSSDLFSNNFMLQWNVPHRCRIWFRDSGPHWVHPNFCQGSTIICWICCMPWASVSRSWSRSSVDSSVSLKPSTFGRHSPDPPKGSCCVAL